MKFTKMQGTGNDFIVVDQRDSEFNLSKSLIRKLSDRNFGIGFDQLLIIEKSDSQMLISNIVSLILMEVRLSNVVMVRVVFINI
jgi:diaminopimelate epimerase